MSLECGDSEAQNGFDGSFLASVGEDNTLVVWNLPRILNLDLLEYGCNWVRDYLRTNAEVEEGNTGNFVNSHSSWASANQPVALISQLIDQFSILTKLTTCENWASQQYNFTQTGQLYLFLVELKN
ncbi:MAG: hypothetical protein ICV68_15775 [Pyrinomonadaceae bacterium]|nr:hypothetical protein [Pyrinomonadaceae bacterium]